MTDKTDGRGLGGLGGLGGWVKLLERLVVRRVPYNEIGNAPGTTPFHPTSVSRFANINKGLGWHGVERLFLMAWGVRVARGLDVPLQPVNVLSLSLYNKEDGDVEALIQWWHGRLLEEWLQGLPDLPDIPTLRVKSKSEFTCLQAYNSTDVEQWFVLVRSYHKRSGVGRFAVLCEKPDRNRLIDELEKIGFKDAESPYESLTDAFGVGSGSNPERMNAYEVDWLLRGGGMDPRMFDMLFHRPDASSTESDVKCPPDYIKISHIKNPLLRVMLAAEQQGLSPVDLELLLRARSSGAVDYSKIPPSFIGLENIDPWF